MKNQLTAFHVVFGTITGASSRARACWDIALTGPLPPPASLLFWNFCFHFSHLQSSVSTGGGLRERVVQ